jgi:hypothetical protein
MVIDFLDDDEHARFELSEVKITDGKDSAGGDRKFGSRSFLGRSEGVGGGACPFKISSKLWSKS